MSLNAHLSELNEKHRTLEKRIQEALNHPSTNDAELVKLKQQKLKVKDEIARITGSPGTRH